MAACLLVSAILLLLPPPAWSQLLRTGPELKVSGNPPVVAHEFASNVAADAAGNFVVTWRLEPYHEASHVLARRYDASGVPLGDAFEIGDPAGSSAQADLAMHPGGDFVIVWLGDGDIVGRRYDSSGAALGSEFVVTSSGGQPAVAQLAGGGFVVAWRSGYDVFAQRYDALGVPAGGQVQANSSSDSVRDIAVAADAAGKFTVVWSVSESAPVRAQRFDAAGMPLGSEISVSASRGLIPSIAHLAAGDFIVTWTTPGEDVMARHFDAGGVALGAEFLVNAYQTGNQNDSAVRPEPGGGFVIAWAGEGPGDSPLGTFPRSGIRLQRYDATAAPVGSDVLVNTYTTGLQHQPAVATVPGGFLVTWSTEGLQFPSYAYGDEVMAQRLAATCGDGMLDLAEQCDDGANSDGDGCDHACVVEHCHACTGAPSSCAPVTTCVNGDGCCAPGCSSSTDDDCPILISGSRLFVGTDDTPYFDPFLNLLFVTRDPAIDTSPGTGIDPAADGAYLHVYDANGSACFELHAASSATWRTSGADPLAPLLVYSDRKRVNGACRLARIRDGREIRVKCNSLRHSRVYPPDYVYAPVGAAAVRFRSGGTEYCSVFGGDVIFDGVAGRWHGFSARNAPVPASCPEPPRPCP